MTPIGYDAGQGFLAVICAWFSAQWIKVFLGIYREHRFNFHWLVSTGGMPSTHSAAIAGLATYVWFARGFPSVEFTIAFAFMLLTMFDAAGVRRAAGKQAAMLNQMMDDMSAHREIPQERLMELLGHTPMEVVFGGLIGILVVIIMWRP